MKAARCVLGSLLLLATAAQAGRYTLGAAVTGGVTLIDDWSPAGHSSNPSFDAEADLTFSAAPFRPGLLVLGGLGRFRTRRSIYEQGSTATNQWGFRLNLSGLAETPFPVQFYATRDWGDFISNLSSLQTGATTTTSFGGSIQLRARRYPTVRLSINRIIAENTSFAASQTTSASTTLSTGLAYSQGTQTYEATYDTGWFNGTFEQNNYQSHAVAVAVSARPSEQLTLRLSDRYFLRVPLVDSPTNPRYDDNAFNVGVQRPDKVLQLGADYSYRRLAVSAAATPEMEQSTHGIGVQASYRHSPNLNFNGNTRAVFNQQRLGDSVATGANQGLGLGAGWRGKYADIWLFTVGSGASIGVSEPVGSPMLLSWGANLTLGASAQLSWLQANLDYSVDFQQNALGLYGSTFAQRVNLTGTTVLKGVLIRLLFIASAARRDDALFGAFFNRSVTVNLSAAWKRWEASLGGGTGEGLSPALQNPGFMDGLFLPAPYNSLVRHANLTISTRFFSDKLTLAIMARTLGTQYPGRLDQWEHGVSLTAGYTLGAFIFSLEDRFATGGIGTESRASNLVMLRVSRSFGWTF